MKVSITELADLDPFHVRGQDILEVADDLLPPVSNIPESGPVTPEKIKEIFGEYFKKVYKDSWGGTPEQIIKAGEKPEVKRPKDVVWSNTVNIDVTKFGEFSMNPDTAGINWEQIPKEKIKVINPLEINPALIGKKRWEVAKYITTEWPDRDRYLIPGIEYWKYVFEHPDEAPQELKNGNWHYFLGSIFCNSSGYWNVPFVRQSGSSFDRLGFWLSNVWHDDERVVLLEK